MYVFILEPTFWRYLQFEFIYLFIYNLHNQLRNTGIGRSQVTTRLTGRGLAALRIFFSRIVCSIREILAQYIKWLFQSNSSLRLYFVPSSRQIYSPVLSWGSSAGWNKNKIERFIFWLHFFEFLEFWRFEMWNVFNRRILTQSKCPEANWIKYT